MNEFRFNLLGFPVIIAPAFYVLCGVYLLFGIQAKQPIWYIGTFIGVVFVSIIVHELGHALAARGFKLNVNRIKLHGFGGDVTHGRGTNVQNLLISLAGPGAGLLLGALTFGVAAVAPSTPVVEAVVQHSLWVNVGWSIFNLLPMYPLDGGNALGSFLSLFTGSAWLITHGVGILVGAAIAALGLYSDMIFVMFIGGFVAYTNVQMFRRYRSAAANRR